MQHITNNVITINTMVDGFSLNISLSNSNALGFIFGPAKAYSDHNNHCKQK